MQTNEGIGENGPEGVEAYSDALYLGEDGHLEMAEFDADMTPPSVFEEVFDLTFDKENTDRLCLALGIGEGVIRTGGKRKLTQILRAMAPYFVKSKYGGIDLSNDFGALLREHGIRTACYHSDDARLWIGSPFNYERKDSRGWVFDKVRILLCAEEGDEAAEETARLLEAYLDVKHDVKRVSEGGIGADAYVRVIRVISERRSGTRDGLTDITLRADPIRFSRGEELILRDVNGRGDVRARLEEIFAFCARL